MVTPRAIMAFALDCKRRLRERERPRGHHASVEDVVGHGSSYFPRVFIMRYRLQQSADIASSHTSPERRPRRLS